MEKLILATQSAQRALHTLEEILHLPVDTIVRDASIQRFEYTFESVWKLLKVYLQSQEGIVCPSPKSCFRHALRTGLLSLEDTETCLTMTDDRNLTFHTYIEAIAQAIYQKLPTYYQVMRGLFEKIQHPYDFTTPQSD